MSINYSSKSRKITKKTKLTTSIKLLTKDNNNQNKKEVVIGTLKPGKKKNIIDKQSSVKILVSSGPTTKIQRQKEIVDELQNKLNLLQNSLEQERQNCISETDILNEQLKDKSQEINFIKNENDSLLKKLRKISDEMDANIQMEQIYRAKMEEFEKSIKNLNNLIEVRKKEMTLEEKRKEKLVNEIQKLTELLSLNDEEEIKVLKEEYAKKNEIIQNSVKEIENLKSMQKIHENCDKIIISLKNKYNLLKNDFQFESKKANMLILQNSSRSYKNSENNIQQKKSNKITNVVDNPLCLSSINNNHIRCLSKNCRNYIDRQFTCLNNGKNMNKNLSVDYNKETESISLLFKENEEKILEKLIPNYYLRNLKVKFDNLESQKMEAKDKFKGNEKARELLKKYQMKIDLSNMNNNTQKIIRVNLNANLVKTHKLIIELKDKIRKINKEITAKKTQIKSQQKTNKQLKKQLKKFKSKIKKDVIG